MEHITVEFLQFISAPASIVAFAIWVNTKFNKMSDRISRLEGWKEGHTEDGGD